MNKFKSGHYWITVINDEKKKYVVYLSLLCETVYDLPTVEMLSVASRRATYVLKDNKLYTDGSPVYIIHNQIETLIDESAGEKAGE